jgi:hypothetical protein
VNEKDIAEMFCHALGSLEHLPEPLKGTWNSQSAFPNENARNATKIGNMFLKGFRGNERRRGSKTAEQRGTGSNGIKAGRK